MHIHSSLRRSALAAAVFLFTATAAHAQTVINSLPYVINTGGNYVLNSNLSSTQTSGELILISASNVNIDFQGHFITGPNNTSYDTIGVYAYERSNISIKNGTIAYCNMGIYIYGNNTATTNNVDHQIDNMRITYCFKMGCELDYAPSSRITNCQVSQIGFSGSSYAAGLYSKGTGVTIQGNAVSNLTAGTTTCIYAENGNFARQNQVSNATYGVSGCIYQDNLAHGCTTPFASGTDGGGNTHD